MSWTELDTKERDVCSHGVCKRNAPTTSVILQADQSKLLPSCSVGDTQVLEGTRMVAKHKQIETLCLGVKSELLLCSLQEIMAELQGVQKGAAVLVQGRL